MKKGISNLVFGLLCFFFALFSSCKDETINDYPFLEDGTEIPTGLDSIKINYEPFFNVKYGLRHPFLKTQSHFYFFETYLLQLFQYSLVDGTWKSNFSYSTDEYISTSKYYFTAGDSVVIVSYYESNHSFNIYSVNTQTLALKELKKNLLLGENLYWSPQSTVMWDSDRIIILLHPADKILTIDMKNFTVKVSQDYHLSGIRHDTSMNSSAMTGKAGRNVYLYYYEYKKLFSFNLDSFAFAEIPIPKFVSSKMNFFWNRCAVISNYICFWPNDSFISLCYDVNKKVWLKGGQNPFYQKGYSEFDYTYDGQNSYYQNGSVMQKISVK